MILYIRKKKKNSAIKKTPHLFVWFFYDSQVESQNCLQIHMCHFLHFFEAKKISLKFQVIEEVMNLTELKTVDRSAPFSLIYNCSIAPSSEKVDTNLLCLKIQYTFTMYMDLSCLIHLMHILLITLNQNMHLQKTFPFFIR